MTDETVMSDADRQALEIARGLIRAGVAVFAAPPCPTGCPGHTDRYGVHHDHPGGPGEYHLPGYWQKTVPSEVNLEKWQPGWALAAVGGRAADFLDLDPRNGSNSSEAELRLAGQFPMTFGQQRTPSGGAHFLIAATGERKSTKFMPGVDLQSGAPDGEGRGFIWIAPTVRRSKDPSDAGELRRYEWVEAPDLEALEEYGQTARDSCEGIIARIHARREAPRVRENTVSTSVTADDPFLSASQVAGLTPGGDRSFTLKEAQDFVRPSLLKLQEAQIGEIEELCNIAAATLSHFVPAFWDAETAFALLSSSLAETAYDPNGPSKWSVDKFRPVLDGRRPPLDPWRATVRPEVAAPPLAAVEIAPGEELLDTYERLKRKLVTAEDLSQRPAPAPLVHDLLNLNTEAWMIGAPGSLKSFVAMDIAGHVAKGIPWHGYRTERRDVLYIAAEGEHGMVLRTRAWIKQHGGMPGVTFLPYPVQVKSNDGQWEALTRLASELKPGLIIIDTQARVSIGLEENSSDQMMIMISAIGRLKRATGACVLTIHHTGRNGGDARGSSAIDGAQDTELKIVRDLPREALTCRVIQDKQKDMAEGNSRGLQLYFGSIDLGQDDHGRPLSSLVVLDGMESALREAELSVTETVDVSEWVGKGPGEWTKHIPGIPNNAKLQKCIVTVLADHAHLRGLTEASARKAVIARWYAAGKTPSADGWVDAWNHVTSNDIACNVGGERWALDEAAVNGLKAAHEA